MMKGKSVKYGRFYGLDNKLGQLGKRSVAIGKGFVSNLHVRDTEKLRYV